MTRLRSVISGIDFYIICLLYFYNMTRYQTSPCDHRIIQPWRHGFQAQNGFERFTRPGDDSLLFSKWPFWNSWWIRWIPSYKMLDLSSSQTGTVYQRVTSVCWIFTSWVMLNDESIINSSTATVERLLRVLTMPKRPTLHWNAMNM